MVIGLVIIAFLISKIDPLAAYDVFISANPVYIALALLVYPITLLILSIRWRRILLQLRADLPLAVAYQAFVAGVLLSDFMPAKLGDLSRPLLVRDWIDIGRGAASVAIDKCADLITVFILGFLGFFLLYQSAGRHLMAAMAFLLFIGILLFIFWLNRAFMQRVINRMGLLRLEEFANTMIIALHSVDDVSGLMIKSIIITIIAWFTQALRTSLIAKAFGFDVPIYVLFFLQPLLSALSLVPITVSGLGLIEGGMTVMLAAQNVPPTIGMTIALADRILTVSIHILLGFRYAFKLK